MCLSACHYDHATDVHRKLAVMAKCESSELSRFCSALRTRTCSRLVARGSALGVRARRNMRDLLCARSYACARAHPGITYHTRTVVLQIRTTATSTPWDVAANTAPTISRGDR
jgi:hypothetical protein